MTQSELLKFKTVLENERDAALRVSLQRRQSIAIEQCADEFEQIAYDCERELALSDLSHHSVRIRQIQAALRRIEEGTFGLCQRCSNEISPKRLMAVPWASLCLRCQEMADDHDQTAPHSTVDFAATAA